MAHQHTDKIELKNELKQIVSQKGKLSRKIGELKKNGQTIDHVLIEMKAVSLKIKSLENQLKLLNQTNNSNPQKPKPPEKFPSHISVPTCRTQSKSSHHYGVKVISNDMKMAWDEYVKNHPASNIYHLFDFKLIIEESFHHQAYYLAALDDAETIVGVLPIIHTKSQIFGSYMTSIPYFNYGGLLSDNLSVEQMLIKFAENLFHKQGASHLELRENSPREHMPSKTDKVSLFLALPESSERLWSEIGTKVRAQIKKGQMNNFVFKIGKSELLDDFYSVFSTNMRDLGTPVYSKGFFAHMLSSQLDSTLVLQYHKGQPVSCAFLLAYNGCLEIPWASTLRSANVLNANMVLYWNILAYACDQGYCHFDFGRSSKDATTFKFKRQWGAVPSQLHWHYVLAEGETLPNLNPSNPKLKLLIACWKRLPLFISNILGPLLARSLP